MPRPPEKQIRRKNFQIKTLLAFRLTGTITQSRLHWLARRASIASSCILILEAPSWVCRHVRLVRVDSISQLWVSVRGPLAEVVGPLAGGRRMTANPSPA